VTETIRPTTPRSRHPVKGRVFPGVIDTNHHAIPKPNNNVNDNGNVNGNDNDNGNDEQEREQEQERERVRGILLSGITPEELKIFDWFEDTEYERYSVNVSLQPIAICDGGNGDGDGGDNTSSNANDVEEEKDTRSDSISDIDRVDADVYLWSAGAKFLDLESAWSFENFCENKLQWYLQSTVRPCRDAYDKQQQQQ
jgi:hypothetical protein